MSTNILILVEKFKGWDLMYLRYLMYLMCQRNQRHQNERAISNCGVEGVRSKRKSGSKQSCALPWLIRVKNECARKPRVIIITITIYWKPLTMEGMGQHATC